MELCPFFNMSLSFNLLCKHDIADSGDSWYHNEWGQPIWLHQMQTWFKSEDGVCSQELHQFSVYQIGKPVYVSAFQNM